jgi:hypothetical protein
MIIDNMDLNQGEEVKRRIRKHMITQGLIEPNEQEKQELGLDQPPPPDPMNEALVQNLQAQTEQLLMQNEKMISEIQKNDADAQKKIMDAQKASVESLATMMKSMLEKSNAGLPLTEQDQELIEGQVALVDEAQADVIAGQEMAGSSPVGMPSPQVPTSTPTAPGPPPNPEIGVINPWDKIY